MKKQTILIIGGSQEQTFKKLGEKQNCDVLFHSGKSRNGGVKKTFQPLVRKADCVVVLAGACGHSTMFSIKDLCKESATKVIYRNGRGVSGAINAAIQEMQIAA